MMESCSCLFLPIGLAFTIATTVFWIWMLVDCVTNERTEGNRQLVWIIVIALTHFLGAVLYFLIRRPERLRELGY